DLSGPSTPDTPRTFGAPKEHTQRAATRDESTPPLTPRTIPRAPDSVKWWRMKDVTIATCSSRNRGSRAAIRGGLLPPPLTIFPGDGVDCAVAGMCDVAVGYPHMRMSLPVSRPVRALDC